jgi:hypothetical protein
MINRKNAAKEFVEKMDEVKPMTFDIKYDADKIQSDADEYINIFALKMRDLASEIIGEIEIRTLPHIETDAWTNYRECLRLELEHEYKFSKFKQPWATNFRRAVFVENREEISHLISKDILERIKHLEDCRQEYEQFRYTPLGDTYQCLKKKNEALEEKLRVCVEALRRYANAEMGTSIAKEALKELKGGSDE